MRKIIITGSDHGYFNLSSLKFEGSLLRDINLANEIVGDDRDLWPMSEI